MARYMEFKETAESKAQCIKLQLKGMIESLYMQQAASEGRSVPFKYASVHGVPLVVSVARAGGQWIMYASIRDQLFKLEHRELFGLYKAAMEVLS